MPIVNFREFTELSAEEYKRERARQEILGRIDRLLGNDIRRQAKRSAEARHELQGRVTSIAAFIDRKQASKPSLIDSIRRERLLSK